MRHNSALQTVVEQVDELLERIKLASTYSLQEYRDIIARLCALQHDISDDDAQKIETACEAARKYRSQHRYQLSEFGLTAKQLQDQFFTTNRLSPRSTEASNPSSGVTIPHDENDDDRLSLIPS